jgi:hypothetical protein
MRLRGAGCNRARNPARIAGVSPGQKDEGKVMLKSLICGAAAVVFLAACEDGSVEKAGEKADAAIDKAVDGKENKGDGALEKAGEAVDKAVGNKNNDPADALHDAVDGDPKTKPN